MQGVTQSRFHLRTVKLSHAYITLHGHVFLSGSGYRHFPTFLGCRSSLKMTNPNIRRFLQKCIKVTTIKTIYLVLTPKLVTLETEDVFRSKIRTGCLENSQINVRPIVRAYFKVCNQENVRKSFRV
jgi:hypothetical protein